MSCKLILADESLFRLNNVFRAYSRHLLHAVSARNDLFGFLWTFPHSKSLKFGRRLEGFEGQIALSFPKSALFIHTACPVFVKYALVFFKINDRLVKKILQPWFFDRSS